MPVEKGGDKSGDRAWGLCSVIDGHCHRASCDSVLLGRDDHAALPAHVGQMPKLRQSNQKMAEYRVRTVGGRTEGWEEEDGGKHLSRQLGVVGRQC